MRWLTAASLALWIAMTAPAAADDVRLHWPLRPPPAMVRTFDAPSPNWNRGHRGVDLAGAVDQPVYAAGPATVVFAGLLAGRPVVSLAHPGGLRTSYEPVRAAVRTGNGNWHVGGTWVNTAGGGCTLPSTGSASPEWQKRLGEVSSRVWPRARTSRSTSATAT